MAPSHQQRFGGAPSIPPHYQQYPTHSQSHTPGLPPPSLGGPNPGFMNANSMNNPFAMSGNALSMSGGFNSSSLGMPGGTGLASQAAQLAYANGGQSHGHNGIGDSGSRLPAKGRIRDVWKSTLGENMALIRHLVDRFPYIAMDTEFPGIVARPMGQFRGKSDYHYQTLRINVDLLKIIQLGITLFNENGETPTSMPAEELQQLGLRNHGNGIVQLPSTWQFNFKFSIDDDMYSEASLETLRIAGVEIGKLQQDGIEPNDFAALLMDSGLVCEEDVRWISFHGGYDFGYITKLLNCEAMPDDERRFDARMKLYFPTVYDIKYLMKHAIKQHNMGQLTPLDPSTTELFSKFDQKASLENLVEILKVKRQGVAHTAGSDAMVTGKAFFKIKEKVFNGEIPEEMVGKVWGLGLPESNPTQSTPQHYHQQLSDNTNTPSQNGNSYGNGTPSTPDARNAGLVSTPGHNSSGGHGPQTPGGGQMGNFSAFNFTSK